MVIVYLDSESLLQINLEGKCETMLNSYCITKKAEVHIELTDGDTDSGGCYKSGSDIYIEANSLLALAHELVHAVQFINNELDLATRTWKGTFYS